jgi:hypothetical protein
MLNSKKIKRLSLHQEERLILTKRDRHLNFFNKNEKKGKDMTNYECLVNTLHKIESKCISNYNLEYKDINQGSIEYLQSLITNK